MVAEINPELEAIITLDGIIPYDQGLKMFRKKEFLEATSLDEEQHEYFKGWLSGEYKVEIEPKQGRVSKLLSRVPGFRQKPEKRLDLSSLLQEVEDEEYRQEIKDKLNLMTVLSTQNPVFKEWLDIYYNMPTTRVDASLIINKLREGEVAKEKFRGFYRTVEKLDNKNGIDSTIDIFVESMTPNETLTPPIEDQETELKTMATRYVASHYTLLAEVYLLMNRKIFSVLNGDLTGLEFEDDEFKTIEAALKMVPTNEQSFVNLFESYAITIAKHINYSSRAMKKTNFETEVEEYSSGDQDINLIYTCNVARKAIEYVMEKSRTYLASKNAFATELIEGVGITYNHIPRIGKVVEEEPIDGEDNTTNGKDNLVIEVGSALPRAEVAPILEGGELEDTRDPTLEGELIEETNEGKVIPPPIRKVAKQDEPRKIDGLDNYIEILGQRLGDFIEAASEIVFRYVNFETMPNVQTEGLEPDQLAKLLVVYADTVDKVVELYETRISGLENQVAIYRSLLKREADAKLEQAEIGYEHEQDTPGYLEGLERLTDILPNMQKRLRNSEVVIKRLTEERDIYLEQITETEEGVEEVVMLGITNSVLEKVNLKILNELEELQESYTAVVEEFAEYIRSSETLDDAELIFEDTNVLQTEENDRLEELLEDAMVSIAAGEKVIASLNDTIQVYERRLSERDDEYAHVMADLNAARDDRDLAIGQRDRAMKERGKALEERDAAVGERDTAVGERDAARDQLRITTADYEGALLRITDLEAKGKGIGTTYIDESEFVADSAVIATTDTIETQTLDIEQLIKDETLSTEEMDKIFAELKNMKLAVHFDSGLLGIILGQSPGVFYTGNTLGIDTEEHKDYGFDMRYSPIINPDNENEVLHRFSAKGFLFEKDALEKGGYEFYLACNYRKLETGETSNIFALDRESIDIRVKFDYGNVYSVAAFFNEDTEYAKQSLGKALKTIIMNDLDGATEHITAKDEHAYFTGDMYTVNQKIAAGIQGAPNKKKAEYHLRITSTVN